MSSKFQQRHFEAIAQVMQNIAPERFDSTNDLERRVQHAATVRALVALFAADNPNFSADRFERACVPGANVRART